MNTKRILWVSVTVLLVSLALTALPQGVSLADGSCLQELSREAGQPANRVRFMVSGENIVVNWTGGGGFTFSNQEVYADASYPNPYLTVTGRKDGVVCGTINYVVQEWVQSTGGKANSGGASYSPVSSAPECSSLVAIRVIPLKDEANGLAVQLEVEGELSDKPFTVFFGDDSSTMPLRDGGLTVYERHTYEMPTLEGGVKISASLAGTSNDCWYALVDASDRSVYAVRGQNHS